MNKYVSATGRGITEGVKAEWDHATSFGGVVEYAIVGKEVRAVYAAARVGLAAGRGAYAEIRKVRTESAAPQPLRAVTDEDGAGRHRRTA